MPLDLGTLVDGAHTAEEAYDDLAPTYDASYLSPKDVAENRWLAAYLQKGGYCDGSVLDVGCGTGLLVEICRVEPQQYMGIDVSDRMLSVARQKHSDYRFEHASMEAMSGLVGEGAWQNAVYLFGTFSYATDQMAAMRQIESVLRPGGHFFVMLLSRRYPGRTSYSVSNAGFAVPIVTYDAAQASSLFAKSDLLAVESVRGISVVVDRMQWLGAGLSSYYRLEAATLGRLAPSHAAYVVVEGRRL